MRLRCPRCKSEGEFLVQAYTFVMLDGDGEDTTQDMEPLDCHSDSLTTCQECGFFAELSDFELEQAEDKKEVQNAA